MHPQPNAASAYSIRDFCLAYGIGRSLTYVEIASGRLPARKVGNRTLILKADAEDWAKRLPSARS